MDNLILHIVLPRGFGLKNKQRLRQDTTFEIIGRLAPYYSTVDTVRLIGGVLLRKLSDMTIACQVYQASQESELIVPSVPDISAGDRYKRFVGARNQWVGNVATRDLMLSVAELLGQPSTHVLANFSVSRQRGDKSEGISAKLKELEDSIKLYEVTLRSGGECMPGERPGPKMAAKGVMDWTERTPGRGWISTGYGANMKTIDFGSATGGRGKPVQMWMQPFYSQPFFNTRTGGYAMGYPVRLMQYPPVPLVQW